MSISAEQKHEMQHRLFRIVPPADGKGETRNVALLLCVIITLTVLLVFLRARTEAKMQLEDWQLSAFHHLEGTDQAVFSALYTASQDIVAIHHEAGHWPTIPELQDYFLPPFAKDLSWTQWGKIKWTKISPESSAAEAVVYMGTEGTCKGQGAYLLILSHMHAPAADGSKGAILEPSVRIWLNSSTQPEPPVSFIPDSLVRSGWNQVIPYSGEMEVQRLKS